MLEIRALGEFAVESDAGAVYPGPNKEAALLLLLASNAGRWVQREELATLLWGSSDRSRRRRSLSQALYSVRQRLGGIEIQAGRDALQLPVEPLDFDVLRFRQAIADGRLNDAVEEYRGEFLEDFWLEGEPNFERWRERVRDELRQTAAGALRALVHAAEEGGRWRRVERLSNRLLRFDPYDESVHRTRLTAMAAMGDTYRAREEHARVLRRIQDELGRDPGEAFLSLAEGFARTAGSGTVDRNETPGPVVPPFVGREREFRLMREQWKNVRGGSRRTITVLGEAGIGKSRFCTRFLRLAALQGARILRGRCYPTEIRLPYSGFVDALLDGLTPTDLQGLPPAWTDVLAELLPELVGRSTPADAEAIEREGARRRLFESIARLLQHVSTSTPIVLFVDDVHWADETTSALIHYLGRQLLDSPVLILLAAREEELPAESKIGGLLRGVADDARTFHIRLAELEGKTADEFIAGYARRLGLSVSSGLHQTIRRQTGGRPLFMLEILRALDSGEIRVEPTVTAIPDATDRTILLPASVEEFLVRRVSGLSGPAATVVASLAVIGKESEPRLVRSVCGLSPDDFVDGLESLIRLRLITDHPERVAFVHDLVRAAAYRSLSAARRRLLHQRVAKALEREEPIQPGTIAMHFDVAGDPEAAFRYALMAADASEKVHAHDEHEFFLWMALGNAPTDRDRYAAKHRLAKLLYRIRRFAEADRLWAALERQHDGSDTLTELEISVARLAVRVKQGTMDPAEAIQPLEALLVRAEAAGSRQNSSQILKLVVEAAHRVGDRAQIASGIEKLLRLADEEGATVVGVDARRYAGLLCALYFNAADGAYYARQAVSDANAIANAEARLLALSALAASYLQLGELHAAAQSFRSALDVAESAALMQYNYARVNFGVCLLEQGEYEAAGEAFETALRFAREARANAEIPTALQNLSALHFEMEHYSMAADFGREVAELKSRTSEWWNPIVGWAILGLCALRRGNIAEANRYRRDILLRFEEHDFWASDFSYAEMFLARMAEADGEIEKGIARLESAIEAYENRDALCRARLRLERARLLAEVNPTTAVQAAEALRQDAARMGARPIVEKTDRLLTRLARND